MILPDDKSTAWGLTSLENERIMAVMPHIEGKLLDMGAGRNTLVKRYPGEGVGVEVYDWGGEALIVDDTSSLPFADGEFDTVTFLACINHIPYRLEVLREVYRVLKDDGKVLITMINPVLGWVGHEVIWWYSEDKERGMEPGEVFGMWTKEIWELCREAGFEPVKHRRFVYGLNNLYIAKKKSSSGSS